MARSNAPVTRRSFSRLQNPLEVPHLIDIQRRSFEELTDPVEQRRRFVDDMELRARAYGPAFPPSPIDEEFLQALEEGLPPSSGIAMGVDRIAMLLADEADIDQLIWLRSHASGLAPSTP